MKRRDLIKELLDGDMDDEVYILLPQDQFALVEGLERDYAAFKKRGVPYPTICVGDIQ